MKNKRDHSYDFLYGFIAGGVVGMIIFTLVQKGIL